MSTLSQRDEIAYCVARVVAIHFDELPKKITNLLDKLHKHLQQVITDCSDSECHKIEALKMISNARSKVDRNFAFAILGKLIKVKDEEVARNAQELLKLLKKNETKK